MNTAEAITFSILVGSAVGMILVGLAVVIAAATAPPARNPRPEDSGSDSDSEGEGESDDPRPLTKTGRYLTDEDIAALADEAEAGYDPNQIRGGRIRRGSLREAR